MDGNRRSDACVGGDLGKRRAGRKVSKETKADGSPDLAKHLQIRDAERIPKRLNPKKATRRHARVGLLKTEDTKKKEKKSHGWQRGRNEALPPGEKQLGREQISHQETQRLKKHDILRGQEGSVARPMPCPGAATFGEEREGKTGEGCDVSPDGAPHKL